MASIQVDALVSIIIPTYYRNDHLEEAINSVFDQSYGPIEIIVVDDSGEEHARTTFERLAAAGPSVDRFEYIDLEENSGPQVARQRGLSIARGEYVQFFDDDDKLDSNSIKRRLELMDGQSDIGVVYSGTVFDDGSVVLPRDDAQGDVLELALRFDLEPCTTSNMLIRAEVLSRITPILDTYTGAGDLALQIDLARLTQFAYVDEPLLWSRRTSDSLGVSRQAVESRLRIIEDYEDVYAEFGRETREAALSNTYLLMGRSILDRSVWSPLATFAYLKAILHAPTVKPIIVGEFLSSLGGRPLRSMARWIVSRVYQV